MADGEISIGLDPSGVEKGKDKALKAINELETKTKQSADNTEKALAEIGTTAGKSADQVVAAAGKAQEAAKKLSGVAIELAKKDRQLAALGERGRQQRATIITSESARTVRQRASIAAIGERQKELEEERRKSAYIRGEISRRNKEHEFALRQRAAQTRNALKEETSAYRQQSSEIRSVLNRTIGLSPSVRATALGAVGTAQARRRRDAMVGFGLTPQEAIIQQLGDKFSPEEAIYLGGKGRLPVSFGGKDLDLLKSEKQAASAARKEASRRQQQIRAEVRQLEAIINRTLQEPLAVQKQVAQAVSGFGPAMQRRQAVAGGSTLTQAFFKNLTDAGISTKDAGRFVGSGGGGAGGGKRGILSRLLGGGGGGVAGGFISGALGGLGIGIGGYAAARAVNAAVEASQTAVAYERQMVAARNLAGSQENLNALMEAYSKASGGAIDKSTTLANVTRLLATGFADTVGETERFVKATRGASIALGKPQDYVIQETQLAISNTSVKRLDQIGLGIREVQERIKSLRKENAGMTREVAFQEAVLGLLDEKYGSLTKTAEGQKTGLELLTASWKDFMLALGQAAEGPIDKTAKHLTNLLSIISTYIEISNQLKTGQLPGGELSDIERFIANWQGAEAEFQKWRDEGKDMLGITAINRAFTGQSQAQINATRILRNPIAYNWPSSNPRGDSPAGNYVPPNTTPPTWRESMGEDYMSIIDNAFQQTAQVNKQYAKAVRDTTRQYEEQRAQIVRDFGKQMAREEEDFARQRARSERDYQRAIVDVIRDSQERRAEITKNYNKQVAQAQEDFDDNIAEMKEDSEKRRKDIEEKYQKDREKAEKDHRDRLLSASAKLDAVAVYEEQKRWARENKEREEGHKEALDQEKEALQERIDDAQKAYDKQAKRAQEAYQEALDEQRKADAKRIEDMRVARERQLADENEDREIRKNRAIEDHNDQLAEMDRQHALTLQKLKTEAEENRQAIADAMAADLAELGYYIEGYQEKMEAKDKLIEKWFDGIIKKIEDLIEAERKWKEERTYYNPGGGPMRAYASGGFVPFTGPAILHAGEYVLNAESVQRMNALNSGSSWSGDVYVNIAGSTNMGEGEMYRVARRAFGDALKELQPS